MTVQDALNKRESSKMLKFQKAKYKKRWRDKVGKYRYEYEKRKKEKKKLKAMELRMLQVIQSAGEVLNINDFKSDEKTAVLSLEKKKLVVRRAGSILLTPKGKRHSIFKETTSQKRIGALKRIDDKIKEEGKVVGRGVYSVEGSSDSIATFISADKHQLATYVSKETGDAFAEVMSRIKKRKDGAFVYEETEDIYE